MTKSTATAKPFFLRQENRYLWFALILPAYLLAFAWVEAWIPADACRPTYIPLDDQIPFLEGFIVPYMLWFPMLLAMGLYLARYDHEGFKRYMTYIGVAFFSVIALYLLFPNRQDLRVTQFPRENLFTRLGRKKIFHRNIYCSWHQGCRRRKYKRWKISHLEEN